MLLLILIEKIYFILSYYHLFGFITDDQLKGQWFAGHQE